MSRRFALGREILLIAIKTVEPPIEQDRRALPPDSDKIEASLHEEAMSSDPVNIEATKHSEANIVENIETVATRSTEHGAPPAGPPRKESSVAPIEPPQEPFIAPQSDWDPTKCFIPPSYGHKSWLTNTGLHRPSTLDQKQSTFHRKHMRCLKILVCFSRQVPTLNHLKIYRTRSQSRHQSKNLLNRCFHGS